MDIQTSIIEKLDQSYQQVSVLSAFDKARNSQLQIRSAIHGVVSERMDAHAYWALHQIARGDQHPIYRRLEAAETVESLYNNVVKGGVPPKFEFKRTATFLIDSKNPDLVVAGENLKQLYEAFDAYNWGCGHRWVLDTCAIS